MIVVNETPLSMPVLRGRDVVGSFSKQRTWGDHQWEVEVGGAGEDLEKVSIKRMKGGKSRRGDVPVEMR